MPGPGILNATAALATAWACSSPVVAIVAAVPTRLAGRGLGALHEIDGQSEIVARLSKWHAIGWLPSEIPALMSEAIYQARSGRPRPVVVEIPADLFAAGAVVDLACAAAAAPAARRCRTAFERRRAWSPGPLLSRHRRRWQGGRG